MTSPRAASERPGESVVAIVPAYNESSRSVERALVGIAQQSRRPERIVMVDDGSPSPIAVSPHLASHVEVIRPAENEGGATARNRGARAASSDYLLFVNSDVVLDPTWVQRAVAFMSTHPEVGAVSGRIVPKVGRKVLRAWRLQFIETNVHRWPLTSPTPVEWFVGHAIFIRRAAFDTVGGFDPRFMCAGEDWDISQRILAAGYALMHLPDLVAESYERASLERLARKSVRNDGWDIRPLGRSRPCAAVRPVRPLAASLSVLGTLIDRSARDLGRRRFSFLPADLAIAGWSFVLLWRSAHPDERRGAERRQ